MVNKKGFLVALFVLLSVLQNAKSEEQEKLYNDSFWDQIAFGETDNPEATLDEQVLPIRVGNLKLGGALRWNYTYKSWNPEYEHGGELDLDTVYMNVDIVDAEPFIGSFQYRYYRYPRQDKSHFYHFLRHGWLGYKLNDEDTIKFGVHEVPFGAMPYASHSWFFQLPYYVGMEADFDLGAKYQKIDGDITQDFAYYLADEGNYYGKSVDSSRYSYDVVEDKSSVGGIDSANTERNQFNYRIAKLFEHDLENSTEIGLSAQWSQIHNYKTSDDGSHYALGMHLDGNYGDYNLIAEAIRYEYSLENPPGISDNYVAMGAYDYTYKVASKGYLLCAGLSKDIEVDWGPIKEVTVYNDYGILLKDDSDFMNSQQNVLGMSFTVGRFFTFIDLAFGRNHPWIGPGWTESLAGGTSDAWHTRFNVNVGYYF